jgi:hypothetical protein
MMGASYRFFLSTTAQLQPHIIFHYEISIISLIELISNDIATTTIAVAFPSRMKKPFTGREVK